MKKVLAILVLAGSFFGATAAFAEDETTIASMIESGLTAEAAVQAAMELDSELSLADALSSALEAGADLADVSAAALSLGGNSTSTMTALTQAALANGKTVGDLAVVADNAGFATNVVIAGVAQGQQPTAAGPANASNNGENGNGNQNAPGQTGNTPGQSNGQSGPPSPPANAGQPPRETSPAT